MKSLIAILFLINCLAFFMLQHIHKQSELLSETERLPAGYSISLSSADYFVI